MLGTVSESNSAATSVLNGTFNSGALAGLIVRGVSFAGRALTNVGSSYTGIFGTITVNADGSWSYTLNNADRDTDLLDTGETAVERFAITYELGGTVHTANYEVAIHGLDEARQVVQQIGNPIRLFGNYAIDAATRVRSTASEALLVDHSVYSPVIVRNDGSVRAIDGQTFATTAISLPIGILLNDGRITSTSSRMDGHATGAGSFNGSINNGVISANAGVSVSGVAVGWAAGSATNNGLVEAISSAGAIGVSVSAVAVDFTNNGLIVASSGSSPAFGFSSGASSGSHIVNNGTVMAISSDPSEETVGFSFFPNSTNPYSTMWFTNSGTIVADTAFATIGGYNVATMFTNIGRIEGAVLMDGGVNVLTNSASGVIDGRIQLGSENDLVINAGTITQSLNLAARGDMYLASGSGVVLGTIHGDDGADALFGGSASDRLDGGADNDLIYGGGGADILTGGAGSDTFVFGAVGDSTATAQDLITDFVGGTDRIDIGALGATSFILTPSGAQTILSVTTATGTLSVAITGSIVASDVRNIAPGTQITGTTANDVLVAGLVGSTLQGASGNDTLVGSSGADMLDGGVGQDSMFGGDGNDIYYVDADEDRVTETAAGGIDEVRSIVSYTLHAYAENLTLLGSTAEFATGNDLDNIIIGNSYNNIIYARGGNDIIVGGLGADTIYVGGGDDIVRYNSASESTGGTIDYIVRHNSGPVTVDLVGLSVTSFTVDEFYNYWSGHYTTITAHTTTGNLTVRISGRASLNEFTWQLPAGQGIVVNGLTGNDLLTGTAGTDTLTGGSGDDTLRGQLGDDRLDGGVGQDIADYSDAAGAVTVSLAVAGAQNTISAGSDTLISVEGLRGSAFDDVLHGNSANNLFDGGAGADRLYGGAGDDTYLVADQADLIFENAGEGVDTVNATTSFYLYDNIENLTLISTGGTPSTDLHLFAVGNALGNRIVANGGNNLLLGGSGNDAIEGLNGADSIFGEDGNDAIRGGFGIDYIVGGAGNDWIEGNSAADALYGGDGDDMLYADSAAQQGDTIGTGMNIYYQADFVTDILVGGAGNDVLYGNSGLADYDLLDGGTGDDAFYVDTGDDLTFEAAGAGIDTVYADVRVPNAGVYLYANVENLVLQGTTAFGVGNELDNQLTGSASGNWLLGGGGNDRLNGMGGNDVLFGEGGNDIFAFSSGNGADVIGDFAAGQDRIDLSAYGFTFAQLQANFVQVGNDGAINLGSGNMIVLYGVTMSQLTASNFILAPVAEAPAKNEAPVMELAGAFELGALYVDPALAADFGLNRWGVVKTDFYV